MMRKVTEEAARGVMAGSEKVIDLDFAVDLPLQADSWLVQVAMFMRTEQVTKGFMINISGRKREVVFIGRGEGDVRMEGLQLRGTPMKQVEKSTYLGSAVTSDGKCIYDIERRRASGTRTFGILKQTM